MNTGVRLALVDISCAICIGESIIACTGIGIYCVAAATVYAWIGVAFIDIDITVDTRKAGTAWADVRADKVNTLTVSTGIRAAFIDVCRAVGAGVAIMANT